MLFPLTSVTDTATGIDKHNSNKIRDSSKPNAGRYIKCINVHVYNFYDAAGNMMRLFLSEGDKLLIDGTLSPECKTSKVYMQQDRT